MKRFTKLFALASLLAYVSARRRRAPDAHAHSGIGSDRSAVTPTAQPARVEAPIATGVGISAVDPEPLTQFGEAVDPDAVAAAHAGPTEQRERLPGKPQR
jgi:hypothetical protein